MHYMKQTRVMLPVVSELACISFAIFQLVKGQLQQKKSRVARIVITPNEICDTYVDFNDDLELDIYVCNTLIRKASC